MKKYNREIGNREIPTPLFATLTYDVYGTERKELTDLVRKKILEGIFSLSREYSGKKSGMHSTHTNNSGLYVETINQRNRIYVRIHGDQGDFFEASSIRAALQTEGFSTQNPYLRIRHWAKTIVQPLAEFMCYGLWEKILPDNTNTRRVTEAMKDAADKDMDIQSKKQGPHETLNKKKMAAIALMESGHRDPIISVYDCSTAEVFPEPILLRPDMIKKEEKSTMDSPAPVLPERPILAPAGRTPEGRPLYPHIETPGGHTGIVTCYDSLPPFPATLGPGSDLTDLLFSDIPVPCDEITERVVPASCSLQQML